MFRHLAPLRLPTPRLSVQITLVMVMMSGLLVVAALIALTAITTFQADLALVQSDENQRSHHSSELAIQALQCRRFEKDLLLNIGDPEAVANYWAKWQQAFAGLNTLIDVLEIGASNAEDTGEARAWRTAAKQYAEGMQAVYDQIQAGTLTSPQVGNLVLTPYKDPIRALTEGALEASVRDQAEFDTAFTDLNHRLAGITRLILGLTLGGGLISILTILFIPRRIVAPLQDLQRAADQLAGQNLGARVPVRGDDELGRLSSSFNAMADTIQRQMADLDQRALIQEQNEQLRKLIDLVQQLETPAIALHQHILLVPLVGYLDERRAGQIVQTTLAAVYAQRAQTVLIDITGVTLVDSQTITYLEQLIAAIRLLGARVVLTGIRSEIAQAITRLGRSFDTIETYHQLQDGVTTVLGAGGYRQN